MLYELRVYHMHPTKLPDIHKRFSGATLEIFKKHNIHVCDFFTDAGDNETIYYVCAFEDMEARDKAFSSFRDDPEWKEVFAASRENGPIVERVESFFMNRVDYITPNWK